MSNLCLFCQAITKNAKFCSHKCSATYYNHILYGNSSKPCCKQCSVELCNNVRRFCSRKCKHEYEFLQRVTQTEQQGYFVNHSRTNHANAFIKHYLRYKFGDKCSICGLISTWNNKPIVMIVDHINGNSYDWSINNLRLVCPNCDSQLPTFKARNKNHGRNR